MRLPGELENDGIFLAHSVVLCPIDWAKPGGDGRASSNGDVIPGPFIFVAVVTGLTSDTGIKGGGEGVAGLLSSLLSDQYGLVSQVAAFNSGLAYDFTYSALDAIFIAVAPPPLLSFAAAFLLSFLDGMVAEGDDNWGDCFRASDAITDPALLPFSVERVIQRRVRSCI